MSEAAAGAFETTSSVDMSLVDSLKLDVGMVRGVCVKMLRWVWLKGV